MKRTWKTLICLFAALVMLFGVACSKSELPKESASLRESVEDTDDAYGNAYRAYTMGKQVLADFYLDNEEGGRGYNYYDKSRTADSWNYVSLLNMVRYMLELYPEDEELLSLYKNAILGMEYFGSIAKGGIWAGKVYCTQATAEKWRSTAVCSYDDSAYIAHMFLEAYELTGKEEYLTKGINQIDFLIDDAYIDNQDVEAFYWCDESNIVACVTNSMLVVDFLMAYCYLPEAERTAEENLITLRSDEQARYAGLYADEAQTKVHKYIYYALKGYDFCLTLQDADYNYSMQTGATYENGYYEKGTETGVSGQHPVRDAHAGFMVSAAVALYEFTGDESYLDHAVLDANAYFDYFFVAYEVDGETYWRPMLPNNWLLQMYARGVYDLGEYRRDDALPILNELQKLLDYAYENTLVDNYLCPTFMTGWLLNNSRHENYTLLDTSSIPAIYAMLRLEEKGIYGNSNICAFAEL